MWLRLLCVGLLLAGTTIAVQGKSRWHGCLPANVTAEGVISREPSGPDKSMKEVTVRARLNQLGARCAGKRLVDARGKPIHFYRLAGCWGNPPENYEEILEDQQRELTRLRRRYRVVEINCNPAGVLIP